MPYLTLHQYQSKTNTWEKIKKRIPKKHLRCCNTGCTKRSGLKTCGKCKLLTYCSRKCQKIHWKLEHSWQCCSYSWYPY